MEPTLVLHGSVPEARPELDFAGHQINMFIWVTECIIKSFELEPAGDLSTNWPSFPRKWESASRSFIQLKNIVN
jgi:hypothetical protein